MRNSGFEMNLVEDYCQHYCIVDREVVWYGSMNFLGKEDSEDNLMRVRQGDRCGTAGAYVWETGI